MQTYQDSAFTKIKLKLPETDRQREREKIELNHSVITSTNYN